MLCVTGILAAAGSAFPIDDAAADGVLVVLAIIFIWRYAQGGRGPVSSRFAAIIAVFIVGWLLLGVHSAADGSAVASGLLDGLGGILSAVGTLITGH
jgi:hypothetical protein